MQGRYLAKLLDHLAPRPEGGVEFVEVTVAPESSCADKKVAEVTFHQSTSIVSIRRGTQYLIPDSATSFRPGDQVTAFCRKVHSEEIRRMFTAPRQEKAGEEE
jgi:Trk K+ transport system NAD-binding subunit